MFERLLIALGLKKKPAARLSSVGRLQVVAAGSTGARGFVVGGRSAVSRELPRKPVTKSEPARRRTNVDDDGFPQTMISSFPESEPQHSRSLAGEEDDVPIPFRRCGGSRFGGGGGGS